MYVVCQERMSASQYVYVRYLTSAYRSTGGTTLMQYVMHRMGFRRVKLTDGTQEDPTRGTGTVRSPDALPARISTGDWDSVRRRSRTTSNGPRTGSVTVVNAVTAAIQTASRTWHGSR